MPNKCVLTRLSNTFEHLYTYENMFVTQYIRCVQTYGIKTGSNCLNIEKLFLKVFLNSVLAVLIYH